MKYLQLLLPILVLVILVSLVITQVENKGLREIIEDEKFVDKKVYEFEMPEEIAGIQDQMIMVLNRENYTLRFYNNLEPGEGEVFVKIIFSR